MKKLLHTYLPLDKFNTVMSIQGRTTCEVNAAGDISIVHGNLQFTYGNVYAKYIHLIQSLIGAYWSSATLENFLQSYYHENDISTAMALLRSLLKNGIVTAHAALQPHFTYHKDSSFGHFVQPSAADIAVLSRSQAGTVLPMDIQAPQVAAQQLQALLEKRISARSFNNQSISKAELNYILWASSGRLSHTEHRTIPSAGALYPIKVYVACFQVEDILPGVYEYHQVSNSLTPHAAILPTPIESLFITKHIDYQQASSIIFLAAFAHETLGKYGNRGYRYALLEAGHIGQNIALASAACDIGCVMVGGFDDDKVNAALDLNAKSEYNVYSVVLGR